MTNLFTSPPISTSLTTLHLPLLSLLYSLSSFFSLSFSKIGVNWNSCNWIFFQILIFFFKKQCIQKFEIVRELKALLKFEIHVSKWSLILRLSLMVGIWQYTLGEVIGQGSYSVVYRGVDLRTSQNVAIKKIHNFEDNGVPKTTIREISVLKELQHDNIVK